MKETRFNIIEAELPYLSPVERLLVKSVLFCFKNKVVVENEDNLFPINDPVIYSFNHNNYWETILVSFYLIFRRRGKKISFVIDWMYGRLPILGWLFNKIEPIYVHNKKARIAAINRHKQVSPEKKVYQECVERLNKRQSIGIFPEGARNNDPVFLKRGRKGVGAMVLASGATVLPIAIHFPRESGRRWLSLPQTMVIRIGKPLDFNAELAAARQIAGDETISPKRSKYRSTLLAAHITHHIMKALAGLSGKRYPYPAPEALP